LCDLHEGVIEFIHWRRGWPMHYRSIDRMPLETATVFTRLLHSEDSEEERADILGDLMAKMAEVREMVF